MHPAVIIIPARYRSTRFPGKPLASIAGIPMIRRVFEQCAQARCASRILVATDDERIAETVRAFGGDVVMTPTGIATGTERVAHAAAATDCRPDEVIVNVQGDEPLIEPAVIDAAAACIVGTDADIGTCASPLQDAEAFRDPMVVKVVLARDGHALYFSRAPIPHAFHPPDHGGGGPVQALRHIGIYAFMRRCLERFAALPPSPLEKLEGLEQLRALEAGMRIRVAVVLSRSIAVDTPEDIPLVEARIASETGTSGTPGHFPSDRYASA
ncbi:MAG: 3-deoxy-manno-octulosonate cytidylyltransferase [Bacteroidota bacterium]|nr:3-deoxy-manno-octulosonate cytidylyltransferase [Bacteroidota bacterium]